jgi:hypothetical protein
MKLYASVISAAIGIALSSVAHAETGLAHVHTAGYIGALNTAPNGRAWQRPTNESSVLSCPAGTAAADCAWGKPALAWRKFGDLTPDALVNVCQADIPSGPFAPPDRPVVDPACGDPCGCGTALDKKTNVLKSAVIQFSIPTVSSTFKLSWTPPTQNTDNSALTDLAGYWIYSAANGAPLGKLVQIKTASTVMSELSGYGPGIYQFAMTAYNAAGTESAMTPALSISVVAAPKVPGSPTGVSITRVELE